MKSILISLHDISPKYFNEVRFILNKLKWIKKKELLVILDWENRFKLKRDLITLLQKEKESKVVLHGLTHYGKRRGFLEKILFGVDYKHIAEFKGLNKRDTSQRISSCAKLFRKFFGYAPDTFVPALWKHNRYTLEAIRKMKIRYSESIFYVFDLLTNKKRFSFVCSFDFGDNRLINRILKYYSVIMVYLANFFNVPLRYAIHPNDLNNKNFDFEINFLKNLINEGWVPVLRDELF